MCNRGGVHNNEKIPFTQQCLKPCIKETKIKKVLRGTTLLGDKITLFCLSFNKPLCYGRTRPSLLKHCSFGRRLRDELCSFGIPLRSKQRLSVMLFRIWFPSLSLMSYILYYLIGFVKIFRELFCEKPPKYYVFFYIFILRQTLTIQPYLSSVFPHWMPVSVS